jgi:alpha-mannosidase
VRKTIRAEYRFEESTFAQEITLYSSLPRIDFRLTADWRHRQRILKVGFPVNFSGGKATFDIPFGAIERSADGKETAAQKWVDVSLPEYGMSLLNDSKYGFDFNGTTLRMTALRAPTDPDPKADEGHHECSYALYPHEVTWREGLTVRRAFEFNTPVAVALADQHRGRLPSSLSFLQLDSPGFVVTALKKSEDDNSIILRGYETAGRPGTVMAKFSIPVKGIQQTDMLEWQEKGRESILDRGRSAALKFGAHEIKTWKISPGTR